MHLSRSRASFQYDDSQEHRNLTRRSRNFSRNLDLLWRDYFKDPSRWWDIRKSKVSPSSPDFKHKITKQPLWLHSCYNPCWVQEELKRLGLHPFETGKGGDFDAETESTKVINGNGCAALHGEDADDVKEEKAGNNPQSGPVDSDDAISLLKDCAHQKNLSKGLAIHSDLVERRLLGTNSFLCNTLLNMYAECGALEEAQDVFDESMVQNVVLWSTLIGGYAKHGHGEKALLWFQKMQSGGVSPNAVTFVCVMKACASIEALDEGQRIHAQLLKTSLLDKNVVVVTALVDMYAKCGLLEKAHHFFDDLPDRNEVSWTALIAAYTQHELSEKALDCYERMQAEGICPNAVTFACVLRSCGSLGVLNKGQLTHAQIAGNCSLIDNTKVASALVTMYAKCGAIEMAQEVFDMLQVRSVSLWNALITGYTHYGRFEEALNCFRQMQLDGMSPDAVTYICILKACGSLVDKAAHDVCAQVVRERWPERSNAVACALVDMHAKCGAFQKAWEVFDEVVVPSVVLWNALISGYVGYGQHDEAIECYDQMRKDGLSPDVVTFACILKAYASTSASLKGQSLHSEIVAYGLLDNEVVGTALIGMYCACGMLMEAKSVFDMLLVRDVVSWSALMLGFAQLGRDDIVFTLFEQMAREGTKPNVITFSSVLCACSHGGFLDKGQLYFELIIDSYEIFPTSEHVNSMLDLFGRAGLLEEAVAVIEVMPFLANSTLWHTFLSACSKWGHSMFGRQAFKHAVRTDEKHPAPFVFMGNMCVESGLQSYVDVF